MNQEYRGFYDSLTFSQDQKEAIAAHAADAAEKKILKSRSSFLHWARLGAAAACLMLVLTVSAEASGISTPLSDLVGPLFGGSVAQCEVIDRIGYPVDAGDSDNGISVQAEAIIGDKYNAAFVFSFRREDGEAILPEGMDVRMLNLGNFASVDLCRMGGSHGSARFVDIIPGDDEIHYIHSISSDTPLNKGTAKVHFKNLYANQESRKNGDPVLKGSWKFWFEVDYEDCSITLGGGESFDQGGIHFIVTEIQLSPIALRVSYEADTEVIWSNAPSGRLPEKDRREVERYLENIELRLTKKGGTVLDLGICAGGSICPEDGKTSCVKSTVLEEILPLDTIHSITVGGISYPLPQP